MLKKPNTIIKSLWIAIAILLIPLLAMQFTNQVNWTIGDFAVAFLLLFTTSYFIIFVLKRFNNLWIKWLIISIIVTIFIIIWIQLAVGII